MIVIAKHGLMTLIYIVICITLINNAFCNKIDRMIIFPFVMMAYYAVMSYVPLSKIYWYNLKERTIPKWTYLWRLIFHYLLYTSNPLKAYSSCVTVLFIMLYKDIVFLIIHAENRLAKIDKTMYQEIPNKRIAHLHRRLYKEDIDNRFHDHCFDTNKIYLVDSLMTGDRVSLGLANYRDLRIKGKKPKKFNTDEEKDIYDASSNKRIFISQRKIFMVVPLVIILWCLLMTDMEWGLLLYINHSLIAIDLLTFYFNNTVNDITIDISYTVGFLVYTVLYMGC